MVNRPHRQVGRRPFPKASDPDADSSAVVTINIMAVWPLKGVLRLHTVTELLVLFTLIETGRAGAIFSNEKQSLPGCLICVPKCMPILQGANHTRPGCCGWDPREWRHAP
jgi:hypothetical protein